MVETVSVPVAVVLSAMLRLAPWHGDHDTSEERVALVSPVAEAISATARTPEEAAALIAVAWSETKFARLVLTGHCDQMPSGTRCDRGNARGPWQVHKWCTAAWTPPDGSLESYLAAARCDLRALRGGLARCASWSGAFAGLLGRPVCAWDRAASYEQVQRTVLGWWSR
jgi:hypothetical protein